ARVDACDALPPGLAEHAHTMIEYWNRTLRPGYIEFRRLIAELSASLYFNSKFDEIIQWLDRTCIAGQPAGTWVVPIDEDDWIDPQLPSTVRSAVADATENLVTWNVVRKEANGQTKLNPNPFIESC